jgi:RNA polymerase sigma-70 factor (ECF subfamily)
MTAEKQHREERAAWITGAVLPWEPSVRAWLARSMVNPVDTDDLIQEAYCRLSRLENFQDIERPGSFFFQIVRNLLRNKIRKARVVRLETVADLAELDIADDEPWPDRVAIGRQSLDQVMAQIRTLPERCRRVLELRRLEGLSQREIAHRLGISENIVEHDLAKALKLILAALRPIEPDLAEQYRKRPRERAGR